MSIHASATFSITYSDIEGGYAGNGNIDDNPDFESGTYWYLFRLSEDSPCIDVGDVSAQYITEEDFDGGPREVNGDGSGGAEIDMGAQEYDP